VGRDGAAEEFADRVVGAVDLVVIFWEVLGRGWMRCPWG